MAFSGLELVSKLDFEGSVMSNRNPPFRRSFRHSQAPSALSIVHVPQNYIHLAIVDVNALAELRSCRRNRAPKIAAFCHHDESSLLEAANKL